MAGRGQRRRQGSTFADAAATQIQFNGNHLPRQPQAMLVTSSDLMTQSDLAAPFCVFCVSSWQTTSDHPHPNPQATVGHQVAQRGIKSTPARRKYGKYRRQIIVSDRRQFHRLLSLQ